MRKVYLLLLFMLLSVLGMQAQTWTEVTTGGTLLSARLSGQTLTDIEYLKISGNLKIEDFNFIQKSLSHLKGLDLSGVGGVDNTVADGETNADAKSIHYYTYVEKQEGDNKKDYIMEQDYADMQGGTYIPRGAFQYMEDLEVVKLPANLVRIEESAFLHDTKLKEISIPGKVITIGDHAFRNCFNLEKITFEKTDGTTALTEIGINAFKNCGKLGTITIPASVKKLKDWSFGYDPDQFGEGGELHYYRMLMMCLFRLLLYPVQTLHLRIGH